MVPLIKRVEDGSGRYALSENYRSNSAARMIRTARWKYCYFRDDREQLFDMHNDPGEIVNLAGDRAYRDTVASLKTRALDGWHYEKIEGYRRKAREARAAGVTDEP
jgi:arylsulfatase A-like enzyme